ncbi:hypothetical protein CKM354_000000900 [Cercospora kikuchii]|uniref:AB hydrolase-1 domain-containing protein n=1 Tax=Cercospora kikuchii TaxID=84275 RepID=A0A9P3CD21_9PEZI|nr:uncharacterized protein CKM354_000000900 [Cercospora kikuchii]GIZ36538.1 hypothetical protein CKM354_000000900 [Cercospora kikuchii]
MINSSTAEYVFIRTCVFLLSVITPIGLLCAAYDALNHACTLSGNFLAPPQSIRVWLWAEAVFYLVVYLPLAFRLQRPAEHPRLQPIESRAKLFGRITKDMAAADLEHQIRGWFRGARLEDIGRDGIRDWLAWALFEGRVESEEKSYQAELECYVNRWEEILERRFTPGHGSAEAIRLTLDPVRPSYRSLLWYSCVGFVDLVTYIRLIWGGYYHHRLARRHFFRLFPLRPVALTAQHKSPASHLSYWHRPHTSNMHLPVVFIHGIGIGLWPYVDFLRDIVALESGHDSAPRDGEIGILAFEIMPVSFRITHSALSKDAMCAEIKAILDQHGWKEFVLISHSYGSVIATNVLHNSDLQPRISSMVFVDPVCFLLHNPDVAYNFTCRSPARANEWQLWYFASADPGVAHTLGRRFFWSENVLWLEDLHEIMKKRDMRVTVSLGERDLIADTTSVGRYLAGVKRNPDGTWPEHWKRENWRGEGLDVIWNEDQDHSQVFDSKQSRAGLVAAVKTYCEAAR